MGGFDAKSKQFRRLSFFLFRYIAVLDDLLNLPTATPADVSLLMQLGMDGVFVGSGIFKSGDPTKRAHAMAQAVTLYKDPKKLAQLSEDLGEAMSGPMYKKDMYKNKYN